MDRYTYPVIEKEDISAPNKINNFSDNLCPAQYVAEIEFKEGCWRYSKNRIIIGVDTNRIGSNIDYNNIHEGDYIISILEGPHTDEYDINYK